MLKSAHLYHQELEMKMIDGWYKLENMYYHAYTAEYTPSLPDNNGREHHFVSVDNDDNVVGYISYHVDWQSMSAHSWGLITFQKGNLILIKDLYTVIRNLFEKYNMNRISWNCYADNPVIRGYRYFVKKFGGKEVGYLHDASKLLDGKLHDIVIFEILAKDYFTNSSFGKNK